MSAESVGMHMPAVVTLDDSSRIPQYWVVDRDDAQTVTLYQLSSAGDYAERAKTPLVWLLQTAPGDHL